MKKKKILKRLKTIISGLALDRIPCDIRDEIETLIKDIQADIKPEREYLTSIKSLIKLYNGEADKITNTMLWENNKYLALHYHDLAVFNKTGEFKGYYFVDVNHDKWWVVE